MRKVTLMPIALDQLNRWIKDKPKIVAKIFELINSTAKTLFTGIGNPEPLKGNLKSYWSRRITQEHRMVYKVLEEEIVIMSVEGHY